MDQVFAFLSHSWWLVFPLMAGLGALARTWERSTRSRHKRRLEILHAKSELNAAKAAARQLPGVRSDLGETPPPHTDRLERLLAEHDATTARWLEYELDVAKMIAFPAMSDGRQELTAAFLRAKRVADGLRPASPKQRITPDQLARYESAVTDYEVAFDVAERDARRIKDASFTEAERKRLGTAKQLLTIAVDQAATPAERQLAYRRARQELDGLVSLSDAAIQVLEERVMLELPAGPTAAPAQTATPAASDPGLPPPPAPRPPRPEPKSGPIATPLHAGVAPGRIVRPKPTS